MLGLSPARALGCILEMRGQEEPLVEVADALGSEPSPSVIARELERRGVNARVARVEARELRLLSMPVLVELRSGDWVLLLRRVGNGWRTLAADGTVQASSAALAESMSGTILDLGQGPSWAPTFGRQIRRLLWDNPGLMAKLFAASVLLELLALVVPQLVRVTVDVAFPQGSSSTLKIVALGVLLVAAYEAAIAFFRERLTLLVVVNVGWVLERGFLEHLLDLPLPFLAGTRLGDRMQAFAGAGVAREVMLERAAEGGVHGLMAIAFFVALALTSPRLTLALTLVSVVMALTKWAAARAEAEEQKREVEARTRERGWLAELLLGMPTLRLASPAGDLLTRWRRLLADELAKTLRRQRVAMSSDIALDALQQLALVALLLWGSTQVLSGAMSLGVLLALLQMGVGLLGGAAGVAAAWASLVSTRPQVAKATRLLEIETPKRASVRMHRQSVAVEVESVWFRYGTDSFWVLRDFDLHVGSGERRRICAPSGYGKTTLLRLIAGLHSPEQGTITVGGVPPGTGVRWVVYVPQGVQLYRGSIFDNLELLSLGASRRRLLTAAQETGFDTFLSALPMGLETVLPSGGGNLSGGQKQLLAVTAALAADRPLVLLDEPFANLDASTRDRVCRSSWWEGRTMVFASHDLPTGVLGQAQQTEFRAHSSV